MFGNSTLNRWMMRWKNSILKHKEIVSYDIKENQIIQWKEINSSVKQSYKKLNLAQYNQLALEKKDMDPRA